MDSDMTYIIIEVLEAEVIPEAMPRVRSGRTIRLGRVLECLETRIIIIKISMVFEKHTKWLLDISNTIKKKNCGIWDMRWAKPVVYEK